MTTSPGIWWLMSSSRPWSAWCAPWRYSVAQRPLKLEPLLQDLELADGDLLGAFRPGNAQPDIFAVCLGRKREGLAAGRGLERIAHDRPARSFELALGQHHDIENGRPGHAV